MLLPFCDSCENLLDDYNEPHYRAAVTKTAGSGTDITEYVIEVCGRCAGEKSLAYMFDLALRASRVRPKISRPVLAQPTISRAQLRPE